MTAQSFDLSVPSITAVATQSYADGSYASYLVLAPLALATSFLSATAASLHLPLTCLQVTCPSNLLSRSESDIAADTNCSCDIVDEGAVAVTANSTASGR